MSDMTHALAFLVRSDETVNVCVGCTEVLLEQGMVEIVEERPLNDVQKDVSTIWVRIVPPFTLDECRGAIVRRHIGKPWGS